uniref:MARVEL domain-containing protein n=1 Tax=Meloidogyne javanica TaxID=6303 RepID=A0A915MHK4_MELJA
MVLELIPFIIVIFNFYADYFYNTIGFIIIMSWNLFPFCLITWFCYLFGIQKIDVHFVGGFAFIPFALLVTAIAVLSSFRYSGGVIFAYISVTALCLLAFFAFAYFVILIYRAIPNGQYRYLFSMIIEGNQVTSRNLPGPGGPNNTAPYI